MKTFTTKQQFIEYFDKRIDFSNTAPQNITLIRDFNRVKNDEFVFDFKDQILQNDFNIFRIIYFFEEVQKIERRALPNETKIRNIIDEFNEMKETDYLIVFDENIDRFVYKIPVNDSVALNENDSEILRKLQLKYFVM